MAKVSNLFDIGNVLKNWITRYEKYHFMKIHRLTRHELHFPFLEHNKKWSCKAIFESWSGYITLHQKFQCPHLQKDPLDPPLTERYLSVFKTCCFCKLHYSYTTIEMWQPKWFSLCHKNVTNWKFCKYISLMTFILILILQKNSIL